MILGSYIPRVLCFQYIVYPGVLYTMGFMFLGHISWGPTFLWSIVSVVFCIPGSYIPWPSFSATVWVLCSWGPTFLWSFVCFRCVLYPKLQFFILLGTDMPRDLRCGVPTGSLFPVQYVSFIYQGPYSSNILHSQSIFPWFYISRPLVSSNLQIPESYIPLSRGQHS